MISLQTRELVLKWKREGKNQQEIAALIGCNQSAVSRLIAKYKETGSVENLPRSGRPTPLTKRTLASLKREFRRRAKEANQNSCSIDVPQFTQIIEQKTGKKYTPRHVNRILHKLDFSRITPRPKHVKNHPKKVAKFRKKFKKKSSRNTWVMKFSR